jgi:hypothetical protein
MATKPANADRAPGPLLVSRVNPRSFSVASDERRGVYLTGSHIWSNLHDGMGPGKECSGAPEPLDDDAYLDFPSPGPTPRSGSASAIARPLPGRR